MQRIEEIQITDESNRAEFETDFTDSSYEDSNEDDLRAVEFDTDFTDSSDSDENEDLGDTELHSLLRHFISIDNIIIFINTVGSSIACQMAKTVNQKNQLPIELIEKLNLPQEERDQLYQLLLTMTLPSIKPLSERLDIQTVLMAYQPAKGSQLEENLKLAVNAVNFARRHIELSSTHPQLNGQSENEFDAANIRLTAMRYKKDRAKESVLCSLDSGHYHFKTKYKIGDEVSKVKFKSSAEVSNKLFDSTCDTILKSKRGNCDEYSHIASLYLKRNAKSADIFTILDGDHVFVVIDRGTKSVDYKQWSKDAVVCDPWAGEVYPVADIPVKLRGYKPITFEYGIENQTLRFNLLCYLNFDIHSLFPLLISRDHKFVFFHNTDNPIERYIDTIRKVFTPREMVHFYRFIIPRIKESLKNHWISENELQSLRYPTTTLYEAFINDFGTIALSKSLLTLSQMDQLPITTLKQLMTKEGIQFLIEMRTPFDELCHMNKVQLERLLTAKNTEEEEEEKEKSYDINQHTKPIKKRKWQSQECETKPIFVRPYFRSCYQAPRETSQKQDYEHRMFKKSKLLPIEEIADQFIHWMSHYRTSHTMLGHYDNHHLALRDWLAKNNEGSRYLSTYQKYRELALALSKRGYNTNPPLSLAELNRFGCHTMKSNRVKK